MPLQSSPELKRMDESAQKKKHWARWGPYVSERQWATVREDYSADGDAWRFFPHEHARSRTYRWGEDGLAGISDNHQRLCFSFALWNGKDKILKERLYGLTNHEGNHGEDVKELYYYLENTPTHSYMKYLYKYPQAEFPYDQLVSESSRRSRTEPEYELLDTGVFDQDRYFDVFVEYAKDGQDVDDVLIKITAFNRGPEAAPLHIIPQVWFRNTWSWTEDPNPAKPSLTQAGNGAIQVEHEELGARTVYYNKAKGAKDPVVLYTENESNLQKIFGVENKVPFVKDAFHEHIVDQKPGVVNETDRRGTKAGIWYQFDKIEAGGKAEIQIRLNRNSVSSDNGKKAFSKEFEQTFATRQKEAKQFYDILSPKHMSEDLRRVQIQAFAGMLWSKQWYHFDQRLWRKGDPGGVPPPAARKNLRNGTWKHLYIEDILSMPDKYEYPFFAAWDMAFHTIPLALVDPTFAKKQLDLLTREWYMHPSGQIPAYEWNFSDVNPPVHAWATMQVYKTELRIYGKGDELFLERVFQKLLLNFTWWVNRKDLEGNNVFEGGFLGLDNIGLFNRSEPLPNGAVMRQADGTSWMAFFALCMLHIALELAKTNPAYEDIASKFLEHFFFISDAMTYQNSSGQETSLWDKTDQFFYDSISWPGGHTSRLKTRSLVGLIPLYATLSLDPEYLELFPGFTKRLTWLLDYREKNRPAWVDKEMDIKPSNGAKMLALVDSKMLRSVLKRMLDETEFLSDYGIRSLSKFHQENPLSMWVNNEEFRVDYLPAESDSGMFGGNSNWRGPIWFPTSFLLVTSLKRFHYFYGDEYLVECPTGSGKMMNLKQVAEEIQFRLLRLVLRDKKSGRRAANGGVDKMDFDEHFKDLVLFYEYFDAENGKGLGASHQTGWTGLLATIIQQISEVCQRKEVEEGGGGK